MPGYLKQSTASQSRALGPFVDDTDFKTAETGLTIANTDIKLVKNGGASANKNSGGGTHRVNGVYGVTFDATDTDTVGEMEVSVFVAGALGVFDKFYVLEEAVFDALFGASSTGRLPANVDQVDGASLATHASGYFPGDVRQYGGAAGTFASGRPEVNTSHIAGSAVSASSAQIGVNVVNAGGTAWATAINSALDTHDGPDLPTGSVATDAGNSATSFKTDRTESTNDYWKDAMLVLTSGTMSGQVKKVSAYNGTTKVITVNGGFTGTPADSVTFALINR